MDNRKPHLGDRAKDIITGFTGIVVGHTRWLTGCDTYTLAPEKVGDDGKSRESGHFDESRVLVVDPTAVTLIDRSANKAEVVPTGGPSSLDSHPTR